MRSDQDLQGAVVIITGGGGLLGQQHTAAVDELGGTPVVLDIDPQKVAAADCPAYTVDIACEETLSAVAAEIVADLGTPYGLINNAAVDPKFDGQGGGSTTRLERFPLSVWERELRVGLTGAFLCARAFGSLMAEAGRGAIVNISSDLGLIAPDQRLYRQDGVAADAQPVKPVTYSVIKHGIIGLTRYLATYWADRGVRCNALAPGGIYNEHPEAFVKKLTALIPMGRMARRDEYRSAIQFLVSEASSYMTGQTLVMDGGRSAW
jgi:NAD(P)-dependent dehydrogenase (short-subunit alcohol dehydrogenase family)